MNGESERCAECGQEVRSGHSSAVPGQSGAETDGLLLTGRLMHVSRLATVGEMASGIAHELNQPLTAIASYAQGCARVLSLPDPDMADVDEALREISAQAVRAGDIIRRMRNLARHDDTQRASTAPNTLIDELLELLQADARIHDTRLRLHLAENLPTIMVNRLQIQHVLLNLFRNAIEALSCMNPQQREVILGTALAADGKVELFVSDTGPGVSPEIAEHMRDPFFTTKPAGTGLGLAVSNTIARAHDGTFGYRPNDPTGACFVISIPSDMSVTS